MARRLTDGVWLLELGLVAPLASNAYLVVDSPDDASPESDDIVTLVDTGLFLNRPSLSSELASAGYDASDIDRVLLTHYDIDHVGGLRALDCFDGPVYLGTDDAALVAGETLPALTHHKGLFHRVVRRFWDLDGVDVLPVVDGGQIGEFTAYHTPGHNPGHTVYVHEKRGLALLGDLVWEEAGELTIPIRFDSYDLARIRESVQSFLDRAPPFEIAAMGHGEPILSGGDDALAALAAQW